MDPVSAGSNYDVAHQNTNNLAAELARVNGEIAGRTMPVEATMMFYQASAMNALCFAVLALTDKLIRQDQQ